MTSNTSHQPLSRTKKFLVGAAGALLLILSGVAIYAILVGPSKEPYRAALTQYKNVYNANVAFTNAGAAINATTASDEEFTKNIDTVQKALNSLKIESEALAKESVLQDGEGKALYDTFSDKLAEYLAYNSEVITSIETLRPVLLACNQKMTNITENAASAIALQNCANDIEKVKNVPDADYKQLMSSFQSDYEKASQAISRAVALKDPEGADKATKAKLTQERNQAIEGLNKASAQLTQDLQQSRNKVDITESAMALDRYLNDKSSVF